MSKTEVNAMRRSNEELAAVLEEGCAYLPRMAAEGSKEARDFFAMGDSIVVNEGDFWMLMIYARMAAERLREAANP